MISDWIHDDFRLDGRAFDSTEELIEYIDDAYPEGSDLIRSWLSEDGKIEVKTSGSTGSPKVIVLTREQMRQSAMATGEYFSLKPGSKALLCLPLKYIAGKMMLVRAMTLGWHLQGVKPTVTLEVPESGVFDFAAMVPLQLENNIEKLERIENLIVGGAPVHRKLQGEIDALSTRIFATYGMTETVTHIALRPLNLSAGRTDDREIYTGLPGVSFEKDKRGCLVIRCRRISEKEIVTNDLVELVADNSFIWRGRIDTVINSGGLKLIPEEIERKFAESLDRRFFAAGITDRELGQKLVFVLEGEVDGGLMDRLKRFQAKTEPSILKHELPRELIFVPSFVETESRKIDRRKTLELLTKTDRF